MPKRVKRPATDPNRRAHQMLAEHMERVETSEKPWEPKPADIKAIVSEHMRKLGAKGGVTSGARRMKNLTKKQRVEIARKGGLARARKAKTEGD